jgi:hypothetical protein
MGEIFSPDIASTPINDRQARDFANRVLGSLANRLGGADWRAFNLERHIDLGKEKADIEFNVAFDEEDYCHYYSLDFASIYPLNDDWDPSVINKLLHVPIGLNGIYEEDEDDDEFAFHYAGDIFEGELSGEDMIPGYLSIGHSYIFNIPYGRGECAYGKSMNMTILDEDFDSIDFDVVYMPGSFAETLEVKDIENLFKYGEVMANTIQYEQDLTRVTFHDLDFIVSSLQAAKLVRSNCQPLSLRVL